MESELIKEEWRPIPGYFELYDASNFGRIRSLKFVKVKILKPGKTKDGYLYVCLWKDGKQKWFFVHRLVWEAFNGEIPEGYEVNHINEIKTDCSVWNINLMSPKENQNYGICIRKRSKVVLQLTYPGLEFMCEWPSASEAGRNGFNKGRVSDCCIGKRKSHRGVTFRYKTSNGV